MNSTPTLSVDGAVARIALGRPAQANRLGLDDLEQLAAHIRAVNERDDVLVLELTASGRHFCGGFDIAGLGSGGEVKFAALVDALEDARPVTIAALQGGVYGGATDLVLACDFRVGAQGIDMFMPAARLGVHYYRTGLERYVSRLGLDQAKRLFLTAERIGAEEMKAIGYLTHLVAPGQLQAQVDALAQACGGMAPIPLLGMKKHLNRIARGRLDAAQLQADIESAFASDDLREGQAAWLEKRAPRFAGR